MSVSEARLNRIASHLEGTPYVFGRHAGHYRIGTLPAQADDLPEDHRADFHAISTTGDGFRGTLREAEAFACGVKAGRRAEEVEA